MATSRVIPKNVIIADTDKKRLVTLLVLVKRFGYNVFPAATVKDFLALTKRILPDAILMDIDLLKSSKQNCLEAIRKEKSLQKVKIITIADKKDAALLEQTLKMGANDSIEKPIRPTPLIKVIEKLTETTQRTCPRLSYIFKVTILTQKEKRMNYASMISEKGLFIRTLNALPVGTKVQLTMDLPSKEPVKARGEIIYILKDADNDYLEPGMGIKFTKMEKKIQKGIRDFVEGQLMVDLAPDMPL